MNDSLDREDEDFADDWPRFALENLEHDPKLQDSRIVIEEMTISDFEQVVAFANEHVRPIFVEGSVIEKARIQTVDIPITIDGADLVGPFDCRKGTFNKELQVWDVSFDGHVSFQEAVFGADVKFEDCRFEGATDFSGSLFEKNVSFISCHFGKGASFHGTRFQGQVDFRDSVFKKRAQFQNTIFANAIDLDKVRFEAGYDAAGSNLEGLNKTSQAQKTAAKSPSQGDSKPKRKAFNPWVELDRVSKKQMTRRDLFRGIRNLIPKRDDT